MHLRNHIFLLVLFSCNNNQGKPTADNKESFIYPNSVDTTTYRVRQSLLRERFILEENEFNQDITLIKDSNNKTATIHFEQFPKNTNMIIPKRFNSDIKRDFVVPEYISRLTYSYGIDTLIKLNIVKELFDDLLDSNLRKYGVLYYEGNYNSLFFWEDSIVINYQVSIPATFINKAVFLKTSLNGNYRVFE